MKRRDVSIAMFVSAANTSLIAASLTTPRLLEAKSVEPPARAVPSDGVSGSVNVLLFGADPSGKTDSSDSLNRAFEAGNEVYLPPGVYKISRSIQKILTSSFRLHGAGYGVTKIVQMADADAIVLSNPSGADIQISIESLSIMPGVMMNTGAALNLRDDGSVPSLTVRDIVIGTQVKSEFRYGIRTTNCTESRFDRVSIHGLTSDSLIAWDISATKAASVQKFCGCAVYNAYVAVKITSSTSPGIEGVQFYGCDFVGVMTGVQYNNEIGKFTYFPPQILWMGGHINAGYRNIDVSQATEIIILGALFYNYSSIGEVLYFTSCSDLNIQNNQFVQIAGGGDAISYQTATIANGGVIANNHFSLSSNAVAIRLNALRVQNLSIMDNVRIGGSAMVSVEGALHETVLIRGSIPPDREDINATISVRDGVLSLVGVRSGFVIIMDPPPPVAISFLRSRVLGDTVILQCDSSHLMLKHASSQIDGFKLRNQADFQFSPGSIISLFRSNSGMWIETSRSS